MSEKWESQSTGKKLLTGLRIVLALTVVVLALLSLLGVWENAAYVYMPLTGLELLLQAVAFWKQSRVTSVINLGSAAFVLICTALIYLFG